MSNLQPVVTNTIRKGKRATYSPYKEKRVVVQKYSKNHTLKKGEKKGKKEETRVAVGTIAAPN